MYLNRLILVVLSCWVFRAPAQSIIIDTVSSGIALDSMQMSAVMLKQELTRAGIPGIVILKGAQAQPTSILLSLRPSSSFKEAPGGEGFSIQSRANTVFISAVSGLGLQNGISRYLETLGFRYYFPNPAWYITPVKPALFQSLAIISHPSFDHRRIWYGYGTGSARADSNYKFWFKANRLGGSLQAAVGHSYDDIVYRNKVEFLKHPDWFYPALASQTIPPNPKFNIANEALVQFVIKDALDRLATARQKNIPVKMITLSPSDGNGTCNTPACQLLGTPTDRVYYLIDRAAKEVWKKFPGTWVSGMAYADYSAPPTHKLEPNTFVIVATAFNTTKYSTEELIREWGKKAGKVGVYDYLGLYVWDKDLPGQGQAGRIGLITSSVKRYYSLGARGYDAESTPGSINKGLGHYLISRLLWEVKSDVPGLKAEFFEKCFGKASVEITALWNQWENYPYDAVRETDLANWFDVVRDAAKKETDEKVELRLTHINSYLHYLVLFSKYQKSKSENDLVTLLMFCYNTMDVGAISGYPALWDLGNRSGFPNMLSTDANAKYKKLVPQFNDPSYLNQLAEIDRKGLQKKVQIDAISLSQKMRKAPLPLPGIFKEKKYSMFSATTTSFNGPHYFVCRITNPGTQNFITFSGGYVTGGGRDMPIIISVTPYLKGLDDSSKFYLRYNYTGKTDTQRISLSTLRPGDYIITVNDPSKMFRIAFSPSVSYSLIITPQKRFNGYTRYLSFFVPTNVSKFRVFKEIEIILISPTGRVIDYSKKGAEEFDVDVLKGEEGIWLINFLNGHFHIEGLPPYFSMNPEQLLIPL